jgi:hypothetical protein
VVKHTLLLVWYVWLQKMGWYVPLEPTYVCSSALLIYEFPGPPPLIKLSLNVSNWLIVVDAEVVFGDGIVVEEEFMVDDKAVEDEVVGLFWVVWIM